VCGQNRRRREKMRTRAFVSAKTVCVCVCVCVCVRVCGLACDQKTGRGRVETVSGTEARGRGRGRALRCRYAPLVHQAGVVPPGLGLADQALQLVQLADHGAVLQYGIELFLRRTPPSAESSPLHPRRPLSSSTYPAEHAQPLHHLPLHRLQRAGRLRGYGRVARREVVPGDLAQRVRQAVVEHLLEAGRAGAWRLRRVAGGQGR
jgi:hypothetical protein